MTSIFKYLRNSYLSLGNYFKFELSKDYEFSYLGKPSLAKYSFVKFNKVY